MPQQSTTEPRQSKTVGARTREQQKAVIEKRENTKGADIAPRDKTIAEARKENPHPPAAYDLSTGDRSIQHGTNQESSHRKRRTAH